MDWQSLVVGAIVFAAVAYLGLRAWRKATSGEVGCDGCGECGKPAAKPAGVREAPVAKPLVTLGAPPRRTKPQN